MKSKRTFLYLLTISLLLVAGIYLGRKIYTQEKPLDNANTVSANIKAVNIEKDKVDDEKVLKLETVKTVENFKKIFKKTFTEKEGVFSTKTNSDGINNLATPQTESVEDSSAGSGSGPSYSETNVQVEGVDEADIIKTNGKHIYHLSYSLGCLSIIDSEDPKNLKLISQIDFSNNDTNSDKFFYPNEMYLDDNTLTVIGNFYGESAFPIGKTEGDSIGISNDMIMPYHDYTSVRVYDISKPHAPKEVSEFRIESSYLTSRKINDIVYLISINYIYSNNPEIPRVYNSKTGESTIINLDRTYILPDSTNSSLTNISAINVKDPEKEVVVESFVGSSNLVYSSLNNLYLAGTEYNYTEATNTSTQKTNIYRFGIDGQNLAFKAKTSIDGYVNNQFSMDEYNNHLRVATTSNTSLTSLNTFFVLDEHLATVGKISNIAEGEQIQSVRFAGEKAYIVTFEQTDPLFVIDAKDPTNPKILGELKIPGYSTYLHPYDDNHLIGLGFDTEYIEKDDWVKQKGIKLTIFDITDLSNPREMFTEVIGDVGTYSEAIYNHKAFMFSKDKNLLILPISISINKTTVIDGVTYQGDLRFYGATIYNIDLIHGFREKAKITHNDDTNLYENVNRSLFVGNIVITSSDNVLKSFDLKTNKEVGTLLLVKQ